MEVHHPMKQVMMDAGELQTVVRGEGEGGASTQLPTSNQSTTIANGQPRIKDNGEGRALLKLPVEVKMKIWALSITVDEPITPLQLRPKSNKFVWSSKQGKEFDKKCVSAAEPLVAVQLSLVCRLMYQEVAATHLFYQVNRFRFESPDAAATYLVAITEPRKNTISSIICTLQGSSLIGYGLKAHEKLWTMIASCGGLQKLEIIVDEAFFIANSHAFANMATAIATKQALGAVQGVEDVVFTVEPIARVARYPHTISIHREKVVKSCEAIKELMADAMKLPRRDNYSLGTLRQAELTATLDVHGGGRLSDDKKPGVIASRTRLQTRSALQLREDGTLPKREIPRYDLNGDLAWWIVEVVNCRSASTDEGSSGVEFLIKCQQTRPNSYVGHSLVQVEVEELEESWEDASVLHSAHARGEIVAYYSEHREAYGMSEVLDLWQQRSRDEYKAMESESYDSQATYSERHCNKQLQNCEGQLAFLIVAKAEREANEATQAAKTTKQSKKTAKKSRKSKKNI